MRHSEYLKTLFRPSLSKPRTSDYLCLEKKYNKKTEKKILHSFDIAKEEYLEDLKKRKEQ